MFVSISRSDGGVSIMEMDDTAIPDDEVAKWSASSDTTAVSWRVIDRGDIPTDRVFREAWRDTGKTVVPEIDAAKDVLREKIRTARAAKFAPLDATISRLQTKALLSTLTPADKQALTDAEVARQKLRDAPANPAIEMAATVQDLAALVPE